MGGGGMGPGLGAFIEPAERVTAGAGDDFEVELPAAFGADEEGEFAEGHAVAEGDVVDADEGGGFGVRRAFDGGADGILAVEDDDAFAVGGGGFHAVDEGGEVGVEAAANVLEINDEGVEIAELGGGGVTVFAVEAVDGEAGGGIPAVGDFFLVQIAADAVFRAEEGAEVDLGSAVEEVDGGRAVAVVAAGVGDQADAEAGEAAELAAGEDVDAVEDG